MIPVWLAMDPETGRVLLQPREFADGDFPRGLRGRDWPTRTGELDQKTWDQLLAGELTPPEQDDLHRDLWTKNGATPWPTL